MRRIVCGAMLWVAVVPMQSHADSKALCVAGAEAALTCSFTSKGPIQYYLDATPDAWKITVERAGLTITLKEELADDPDALLSEPLQQGTYETDGPEVVTITILPRDLGAGPVAAGALYSGNV